jgi:hypothetical protein
MGRQQSSAGMLHIQNVLSLLRTGLLFSLTATAQYATNNKGRIYETPAT